MDKGEGPGQNGSASGGSPRSSTCSAHNEACYFEWRAVLVVACVKNFDHGGSSGCIEETFLVNARHTRSYFFLLGRPQLVTVTSVTPWHLACGNSSDRGVTAWCTARSAVRPARPRPLSQFPS
jgi:hypothetical protein